MNKNYDCIDGNMDVLMYDNTIKKVSDLKKNDAIYSISYDGEDFRYTKGYVLEISKKRASAVKITLKDKRTLICSPDHQWLTQQGWHFSFDDKSIADIACFLKRGMIMFGFSQNITARLPETRLYMEGYIISLEIYGRNLAPLPSGEHGIFVFHNVDVARRAYNYLCYLGIESTLSDYLATDINTNETFMTKQICVSYKDMLKFSEKSYKRKDNAEFIRGFVAGVYDADGNINPLLKHIKSPRQDYLSIMKRGMELYEFEYSYNSEFMEITLIGGPTELIRFYNIFTPVNTGMVENLTMRNRRLEKTRIAKIEEVKCNDLYEITTSTRNLIINGIVCHDCITV